MNSRHTTMTGRLVRSFGFDGNEDLVVELVDDGQVIFRKEPTDRKIRRGEQLPERRLNVREVMKDLLARPAQEMAAAEIIEAIIAKLPIAKFEEDEPKNIAYAMKVWLLNELKKTVTPERDEPDYD